ncbi:MAG: hypothetical protein ACFFAS_15380 [Promethearchaeota archaeon]
MYSCGKFSNDRRTSFRGGGVYLGAPAVKYKKNRFFEDNIEEKITNFENIEILRDKYEEKYTKWYDNDIT